jgi:thiol-disulfide isomerase/thioredoxin
MLDRIRAAAGEVFANKQFLLIVIVVAALIATTVFVYKRYVAPKVAAAYAPNKEYIKESAADEGDKVIELYMFSVDWCPHCKKALPEWNAFKESIGDSKVNGYSISFIEVDCEKEKGMAEQWGVKGYPTIKAKMSNGNIIDYDAKPTAEVLTQFLDSITGPQ